MTEKSPYMMVALLGSLILMMTTSLVFHVGQNSTEDGMMSNFFAMNPQGKNIGGEIDNRVPTYTTSLRTEFRR